MKKAIDMTVAEFKQHLAEQYEQLIAEPLFEREDSNRWRSSMVGRAAAIGQLSSVTRRTMQRRRTP